MVKAQGKIIAKLSMIYKRSAGIYHRNVDYLMNDRDQLKRWTDRNIQRG